MQIVTVPTLCFVFTNVTICILHILKEIKHKFTYSGKLDSTCTHTLAKKQFGCVLYVKRDCLNTQENPQSVLVFHCDFILGQENWDEMFFVGRVNINGGKYY